MGTILIIKCGETFSEIKEKHGDFEDWIISQSNLPGNVFKIINVANGVLLRHPSEYLAAIITGSHSDVHESLHWMKTLKDWIASARYCNIPILGIGFGHQILAEAIGGTVKRNKTGRSIGIENIQITPDGKKDEIFKNTGSSFESYVNHSFHVESLPSTVQILAINSNNYIQSFKIEKIYGIQFHVEYTVDIMQKYFELLKVTGYNKIRVQLKSAFKNQSILSNFLNQTLKFLHFN